MRRLSVGFVSVLAIGSVWLAGLAPTHAQAPQATFKADVNVIEVDARVSGADGVHIADLTVNDFEVLDDGQPQKIELFSYVDIPVTPRPVFAGVDRPVSPDVRSTSDPATGRMYIIVLDDANIEAIHLAAVKRQAREFIEEYLGAGDIASIAYTSGTTNASQDFTSDPQVLLAAVDRFVGRRGASAAAEQAEKFYQDRLTLEIDTPPDVNPEDIAALAAELQNSRKQVLGTVAKPTVDIRDFERAQRAVNVLATVRQLAQSVENVRGRRKALVLFSEGIGYQLTDPFGMRSVSDIVNATRDAINAAARANVNFYTIDPRGLVGASSEGMQMTGAGMPEGATQVAMMNEFRTSQDSLRVLAEETGGFASLDSNSFASSFERIVDSNSRYYVIGYRLPDRPADGQFHKIEVRVKRPGVTIVARKGYGSSRDRSAADRQRDEAERRTREARRPNADKTSTELRNVLDSAIPLRGLTFSVHAAPFRNTEKEASVAMTVEIAGDRLPLAPPGKLEVSFYGVDAQGKASTGVRKEIDLGVRSSTSERVKMHGIRLNPRIALAPGRYQLRIGARESTGGENGSIFYDLIVPDFHNEAFALSGLLLTSVSAQQTPTAEPDPAASKELPGAATSRRTFPVGDTLAIYAEVYDNAPAAERAAIDVAVQLISEAGVDVFSAKDSIAAGQSGPSNIAAQFALEDLEPGMYLLRVEAQRSGSSTPPIARETVITVVR